MNKPVLLILVLGFFACYPIVWLASLVAGRLELGRWPSRGEVTRFVDSLV